MSISQNFPEEGPTLNLNFAGSKVLDPRITFARPSTSGDATYMDANGLIVTAAADEPRFDHRYVNGEIESLGLLIEESRENLVEYSESFDSWGSGNVDIGINTTTAPDGTQNADSLIGRDQNYTGGAYRRRTVSIGSTYSGQLTFSVFLKSAEVTTVGLIIVIDELNDPRANVDLTSPTTSGNGTNSKYIVESFPNDWKRVSIASTDSLSNYTGSFSVAIYLNGYLGFDNRGNSGNKVFVWGAQLEKGAFPTSYIPTEGSTKTRSPDSVSMTGTNFSDWYNQSEGTVYADTRIVGVRTDLYNRLWVITNSNLNYEGISVYVAGPIGFQGGYVSSVTITNTGTEQVSGTIDVSAITTPKLKSAFAFKQNDCASGYNGDLKFVDNTVGLSSFTTSPDRLLIGQPQRFQGYSCMTVSQLTYYPTRLSNTQLQNLTK